MRCNGRKIFFRFLDYLAGCNASPPPPPRCRTQKRSRDDSGSRPLPESGRSKRPFLFSTHSHVASRGSGGGATVAKPTRSDAGTVLHTFRTLCAVRSCCLATGGAARCSAAGERLIAGHRPTVFGRVASAGAESDCVMEVLECSSTPWAPRSDLHHRSGQGAFERLRAASPEVGTACRVAGHRRRSAAHSRADSELKSTVCVNV